MHPDWPDLERGYSSHARINHKHPLFPFFPFDDDDDDELLSASPLKTSSRAPRLLSSAYTFPPFFPQDNPRISADTFFFSSPLYRPYDPGFFSHHL